MNRYGAWQKQSLVKVRTNGNVEVSVSETNYYLIIRRTKRMRVVEWRGNQTGNWIVESFVTCSDSDRKLRRQRRNCLQKKKRKSRKQTGALMLLWPVLPASGGTRKPKEKPVLKKLCCSQEFRKILKKLSFSV